MIRQLTRRSSEIMEERFDLVGHFGFDRDLNWVDVVTDGILLDIWERMTDGGCRAYYGPGLNTEQQVVHWSIGGTTWFVYHRRDCPRHPDYWVNHVVPAEEPCYCGTARPQPIDHLEDRRERQAFGNTASQ